VFKPLEIGKLQDLRAGWGIMMDDVGAGVAGAVVVYVLRMLLPNLMESSWPLS
jgi:phosphatidylglycerophosphatase A